MMMVVVMMMEEKDEEEEEEEEDEEEEEREKEEEEAEEEEEKDHTRFVGVPGRGHSGRTSQFFSVCRGNAYRGNSVVQECGIGLLLGSLGPRLGFLGPLFSILGTFLGPSWGPFGTVWAREVLGGASDLMVRRFGINL